MLNMVIRPAERTVDDEMVEMTKAARKEETSKSLLYTALFSLDTFSQDT